jgi:hypothetical protein
LIYEELTQKCDESAPFHKIDFKKNTQIKNWLYCTISFGKMQSKAFGFSVGSNTRFGRVNRLSATALAPK